MKHIKLTFLFIFVIVIQGCSKNTDNEYINEIDQDLIRLTNNPAHDMRPEWSPDGSTIGFISNRGGSQGSGWYGFSLWKISVNGGAETKIETGRQDIHQMSWSSDGNTITFYAGQNEPQWDVFKIPSAGGQIVGLTSNHAGNMSPRFSPNGTKLVFASKSSGNFDVWTMNVDGTNLNQITQDPGTDRFPCYSPDGQKIAFSSNRYGNNDLMIFNLNDQSFTRLTSDAGNEFVPVWSPNGEYIAYMSDRSGSFDIYIIPSVGGESIQFTTDTGDDMYPSWSPDGTKIAFSSNRTGNDEIWVKEFNLNSL